MALHRQLLVSIAMVMAIFCGRCFNLQYLVGDSIWSIPPYPNYYSEWSSSHLFYNGDSLVFGFETDVYNLIQVLISDYQNCTANNPVNVLNDGPATVLLNHCGIFYSLCNFSEYCHLDQKISIIVHDTNYNSPAPSPSTSPSPGNWIESVSPGSGSGEAASPAYLGLHLKSSGPTSSGLASSSAAFCFAIFFL